MLEAIKKVQENCSHKDVSNWILVNNKTFVKICLTCDKKLDEMEVK
jgi:hypothetical protein